MKIRIIFVLAIITLLLSNCDTQPSSTYNLDELDASLVRLIEDDDYLSINPMTEDESFEELLAFHNDGRHSFLNREVYEYRIKWRRFIENISSLILIESHETDSDTIYASIDKIISGYLRIINLDTVIIDSSVQFISVDTTEKPFTMDSQRRVRIVRLFGSNDIYLGWRITGRTPLILSSETPTVGFTEIAFHDDQEDGFNSVFSLQINDGLMNTFYRIGEFPVFYPGQSYNVTAAIVNSNPEADLYPDSGEGVYMHKIFRNHHIFRKSLFDDGLPDHSGDITENDNLFTRYFQVRELGIDDNVKRNITFEIVDYETLLNEDGNYHSFIIGFPFFISP